MPSIIKFITFSAFLLSNPVLSKELSDFEFFYIGGRLSAICNLYQNGEISKSTAIYYIEGTKQNTGIPEAQISSVLRLDTTRKEWPDCPI